MGWFDDLTARVEQGANQALSDINSYVSSRVTDAVVKVAAPPAGNQNAAQIAAGQYGGAPPQAPAAAAASATANAAQASQLSMASFQKYLPYIAIAAVGLLVLGKRGRK